MSRNAESRFSLAPSVNHPRSTFDRPFKTSTAAKVGDLIPFYVDEVLAGDTFQVNTNAVIRMTPMVSCPYDDLLCDIYYFFVPNRIVMDDWIRFFGESDTNAWTQPPNYKVPFITAPSGGWNNGTIADFMGIPTKVPNIKVNALPFRAFAKVYEEFFRDENVQDHVNIPTDSVNRTGVNTGNYVTDMHLGGLVPKANKLHDYFTSCLPNVSKGSIAEVSFDGIPVVTGDNHGIINVGSPMTWDVARINGTAVTLNTGTSYNAGIQHFSAEHSGHANRGAMATYDTGSTSAVTYQNMTGWYPANLEVGPMSLSIPALRTAFQIQRFLELLARTGSRYVEAMHAIYSVNIPDYRAQRPEYLGGQRIDISVNQVLNMSAPQTSTDDPLGTVGAYSLTNLSGAGFTHSFVEHGFVIGCMTLRYKHTYTQGLARFWSRGNDRTDYYMPVFGFISEQPVYKKELMATGTSTDDDVFGYQEAWADLRWKPSNVTNLMRSNANSGLDAWHFADNYASVPTLSDTWMAEDHTNIDRALAVSSATAGFQYYADIIVNNKATRLLPLYSVPGLIDHN